MTDNISCLIVDDHAAVRAGVRSMLDACFGIKVAGEAESGEEAIEMVTKIHPMVTILDVKMPRVDGFRTCQQIKRVEPKTRVLMFTAHSNEKFLHLGLEAGATGFLLKEASGHDLERAVRAVAEGKGYVDAVLAPGVIAGIPSVGLTAREREVLANLAAGHTTEGTAENLHIAPDTVRTHVRNAQTKLAAKNRVHAVALAVASGVILPPVV